MKYVHSWHYVTRSGELVGHVKRFEDHNGEKQVIPYFRKVGDNFEKGGESVPRTLYGLLSIQDKKSVTIHEGEKCCAALHCCEIAAVTSQGGSSAASKADWSALRHVEAVYIFPDNDKPGMRYAMDVAAQIADINKNCKFYLVHLPDLPEKGDVVDFIQQLVPTWGGYTELEAHDALEVAKIIRRCIKDYRRAFSPLPLSKKEAVKQQRTESQKSSRDEVKSRLTCRAVLSHYGVNLTGQQHGNYFRIRSPWSNDSTPSFDFNDAHFKDFSSNKEGDVFNLIAELEHWNVTSDFPKILEKGASIAGVELQQQQRRPQRKAKVVDIKTREELGALDMTQFTSQLKTMPADASLESAWSLSDSLLRFVAASNGNADNTSVAAIRQHFRCFRYAHERDLTKVIKHYRQELVGDDYNARQTKSKKTEVATADMYLDLYPKLMGEVRRDIFTDELMLHIDGLWQPAENYLDLIKSRFIRYGEDNDIQFSRSAIIEHFQDFRMRQPAELLVDVPQWDGRDRIRELVQRLKLGEHIVDDSVLPITNEHVYQLICEWHARMWGKMEEPEEVQNRILILKGNQDIGKDFWLNEMIGALGQFAVPLQVESGDKDVMAQLHYGLVCSISEFDRADKKSAALLKVMLTAPTTHLRFSYDRRHRPRAVRCSFVASCNVDNILRDDTGNRRYMIVVVDDIDKSHRFTKADRLQVLAQGQALRAQHYKASDEARQLMNQYIAAETPERTSVFAAHVLDETAQRFLEKLSFERLRQMSLRVTGTKVEALGASYILSNDEGAEIIEATAKRVGVQEFVLRRMLKVEGRLVTRSNWRGFWVRDLSSLNQFEQSQDLNGTSSASEDEFNDFDFV